MGLLFVCIGGVIGALARYYFGILVTILFPKLKKYTSTLLINGIGSFILGILLANFTLVNEEQSLKLMGVTVGIVGSFTTYSSFSLDCVNLLQKGRWREAVLYVFSTLLVSVGLFYVGFFFLAVS